MLAQNISFWVSGYGAKTIISLDLYEKAYLLIRSRTDLIEMFIDRLGELHIEFAVIRAIGKYMENSGIEQAWIDSGWFGSCRMRQVLTSLHLNRAMEAHGTMLIVLYEFYVEAFLKEFPEFCTLLIGYLFQMIRDAHEALESKNYPKVREINSDMKSLLQQTELIQ